VSGGKGETRWQRTRDESGWGGDEDRSLWKLRLESGCCSEEEAKSYENRRPENLCGDFDFSKRFSYNFAIRFCIYDFAKVVKKNRIKIVRKFLLRL
jgi:hypothetical protein